MCVGMTCLSRLTQTKSPTLLSLTLKENVKMIFMGIWLKCASESFWKFWSCLHIRRQCVCVWCPPPPFFFFSLPVVTIFACDIVFHWSVTVCNKLACFYSEVCAFIYMFQNVCSIFLFVLTIWNKLELHGKHVYKVAVNGNLIIKRHLPHIHSLTHACSASYPLNYFDDEWWFTISWL